MLEGIKRKEVMKCIGSIILLMIAVIKLATYNVKLFDMVFILMLPIFADSLIYQIIAQDKGECYDEEKRSKRRFKKG